MPLVLLLNIWAESHFTAEGKCSVDINGGYANGIYVSGKWDTTPHMRTINLNDASIKIANSDNAIKKEKNRLFGSIRDGWGAGLLNLKDGANVNIDQSNATSEVIAMVYGGSVLNAPATQVFKIVYQGNSIRVGNEILTSSLQASQRFDRHQDQQR